MKKIIALILALMMVSAVLVSCDTTGDNTDTTTTAPTVEDTTTASEGDTTTAPEGETTTEATVVELPYTSAMDLADKIYAAIPEDKKFPGGGVEIVLGTEDAALTLVDLGLPAEFHDKLETAGRYVHMLNANSFSAGVYQFKTAEDAAASVEALKNGINGKMWYCGFPEKLAIITLPGNYVIAMFGLGGLDPDPNFSVDFITPYIDAAKTIVDGVAVSVNEKIA